MTKKTFFEQILTYSYVAECYTPDLYIYIYIIYLRHLRINLI